MTIIRIIVLIVAALSMCCRTLSAQELGMTYTTELQTDFRRGANWVNLLRTDFQQRITPWLSFDFASISIAKTRNGRLADDMLTFSNIEEDNLAFAPAVLGLTARFGRSSLSAGIRNVNEDYFTSGCTSLFTNSSCGIFPTVSMNFPIANYPLASVGLHYTLEAGNWNLMSSLYNGMGFNRLCGRENVFRFCPETDGIFSITSVNYKWDDSGYYCGFALHSGEPDSGEKTYRKEAPEKKKKVLNAVFWAYAEQSISRNLHLLLQYSVAPGMRDGCRHYAAAGVIFGSGKNQGGAVVTYADFGKLYEYDIELTWKINFSEYACLQPAVHFIRNSSASYCIGIIRFACRLITN